MKKWRCLYDALPKRQRVYLNNYNRMPHYIYTHDVTQQIKFQHIQPETYKQRFAFKMIQMIRGSYDRLTSYDKDNMTEAKWVRRCLILETVAGVPGMVGGMARHLKSLRSMNRDKGWINHLLEEADNQRFHLFIFLNFKKPTFFTRWFIISLQGIFFNFYFLAYLVDPKTSHRFVAYLQQQAVRTYTVMLQSIDNPEGSIHHWSTMPAPDEVKDYYQLQENSTMRDVIACIRADQACHRQTNHYLASVDQDAPITKSKLKVINDARIDDPLLQEQEVQQSEVNVSDSKGAKKTS